MVYFFDFNYVFQQWQSIGIFDVFLPFCLIFTILFAILQKTQIFQARKGIDMVVAMAIAAMVMINPFVADIMKIVLQNTVIAILVVVALMLLMGLAFGSNKPKIWKFVGYMIGLVFIVWLLGRVADYYELYYPGTMLFSTMWWQQNLPWIVPILIIIIFAIIVISSGSDKPKGKEKTFGGQLIKLLSETEEDEGW